MIMRSNQETVLFWDTCLFLHLEIDFIGKVKGKTNQIGLDQAGLGLAIVKYKGTREDGIMDSC